MNLSEHVATLGRGPGRSRDLTQAEAAEAMALMLDGAAPQAVGAADAAADEGRDGGGEQAAQKTRLMLKTDARIVLAAPALDGELAAQVSGGRAEHHTGPITPALFEGARWP